MSTNMLRIATRQSKLALWQAEFVKTELEKLYPRLAIEILAMKTQGDIILDVDGADILMKDAGTQFAAFTNNSANLILKSGSTTAATFLISELYHRRIGRLSAI